MCLRPLALTLVLHLMYVYPAWYQYRWCRTSADHRTDRGRYCRHHHRSDEGQASKSRGLLLAARAPPLPTVDVICFPSCGQWDARNIRMLVLDEADVMVDEHQGQAADSLTIKK